MPLDSDAQEFLNEVKCITSEIKLLRKTLEENNVKIVSLCETLKNMVDGDPRMKIPPLNVNLARLAHVVENNTQVNAALFSMMNNIGKGVNIVKAIKKFFPK